MERSFKNFSRKKTVFYHPDDALNGRRRSACDQNGENGKKKFEVYWSFAANQEQIYLKSEIKEFGAG